MARRALKPCSTSGCPELVAKGRCPECIRQAEARRGTARQRGYGTGHTTRFRQGVLALHPVCQLCSKDWSKHADHWPVDRRTLVLRGQDPNDPQHGRGLCHSCHSTETAEHQPGGWNAR
ncbi:holin [Amycolatopsis sp. WAC 04182]|nr:holin [Amycolatopsis sp. WAC 04182]